MEMTAMQIDRAVVEQALEALEYENSWHESFKVRPYASTIDAITALRAALAQQAEPLNLADPAVQKRLASQWGYVPAAQAEPVEPVAWRWGYRSVTTGEMDWRGYVEIAAHPNLRSPEIIIEPLYTAPPKLVPLTEEVAALIAQRDALLEALSAARCAAEGAAAQRDALLEALKYLDKEFRQHGRQHWPEAVRVRAAIKSVEEGK